MGKLDQLKSKLSEVDALIDQAQNEIELIEIPDDAEEYIQKVIIKQGEIVLFEGEIAGMESLSIGVEPKKKDNPPIGEHILTNDFSHLGDGPYDFYQFREDWLSPEWQTGITHGRVDIKGNTLVVKHLAGSYGSSSNQGGCQWPTKFNTGYQDLWLQYRVKFEGEFDWVKGGKLPGLFGGERPGGGVVSGGHKPDGTDGFSTRFMWEDGGKAMLYAYHMGQPDSYGDNIHLKYSNGKRVQFKAGQWYELTQHVKLNTPGKANGFVHVWLDDKIVLDRNDLAFRAIESIGIDGLYFSNFFGGSDAGWAPKTDQHISFDGFIVSQKELKSYEPTDVNTAPIVFDIVNQTNTVGDDIFLNVRAEDSEGDSLRYEAAGLPDGLNLSADTGLIRGKLERVGNYFVSVSATDGNLWGNDTFSWEVKAKVDEPLPGTRTVGDVLGTNVVFDNHMDLMQQIPNLRLYFHTQDGYKANDRNSIHISPILGFGGAYDLPKWIAETKARVMVAMKNNPPFCPGPDGPSAKGDRLKPESYQDHANAAKMMHDALVNVPGAEYIGLGNEWYEHWKPGGDWTPEETAALGVQLDKILPRTQRKIKLGGAGDVAYDSKQIDREYQYLQSVGFDGYPWDYKQLHIYYNQSHVEKNDYKQGIDFTNGPKHPEWGPGLRAFTQGAIEHIRGYWPGLPVIIGEMGYDIGYPPDRDDDSPNRAKIEGVTSERTQADWLVRSYLAYAATDVEVVYQYMLDHVNHGGGGWLFGSSGLVDGDNSKKMISWYYTIGMLSILKDFVFDSYNESGAVRIYTFSKQDAKCYAVWSPTAENNQVTGFSLPGVSSGTLYELSTTSEKPVSTAYKGNITIDETPRFIVV